MGRAIGLEWIGWIDLRVGKMIFWVLAETVEGQIGQELWVTWSLYVDGR